MVNITKFDNIERGMEATLLASYRGFVSWAPQIDYFVGVESTVERTEDRNICMNWGNTSWWYPPFSLQIKGDSKPHTIDTIEIGKTYTLYQDMYKFDFIRYTYDDDDNGGFTIPPYKNLSMDDIMGNSWKPTDDHTQHRVTVLQVIPMRPRFNDYVVLCKYEQKEKLAYLPLSALYGNSIPMYKPRKFVYEYNQWKDS